MVSPSKFPPISSDWIGWVPPQNLRGQWKIYHLKMYFLLKIVIFQRHVSFQGCIYRVFIHSLQDKDLVKLGLLSRA